MKRTFSRAKQKAIIKRYQRKARLTRNADVLVSSFPRRTISEKERSLLRLFNLIYINHTDSTPTNPSFDKFFFNHGIRCWRFGQL